VIPRIISQMWVGPPMPDLYRQWSEQWEAMHPDWEYVMWTEDNLPPLANQSLWDNAETISPHAVEQFRSDVARYEIMYEHGGVWLDIDIEPHKPIDDLCDNGPWVVRHARKWVANGILAFPARHPAMEEAIDSLADSVLSQPVEAGNTRKSGPQFFTPIVKRHRDVRILPAETFIAYEWDQLERHGKVWGEYGTHHWNRQRTKRGMELG
jgi:inositol phosphorylceramide mannosyltransferase catalytic subunit